jgi:hypothetical protein
MTMASGRMASRLRAVSISVSPFWVELVDAEKASVSALSRLAASSKESLVRVEFSKKTSATVRPRRVGTFLIRRSLTVRN